MGPRWEVRLAGAPALCFEHRTGAAGEKWEERARSSNDPSSFLCDSAGGLSVPPKASGRGAAHPSGPLVLPEQDERQQHAAGTWWERPHGGVQAGWKPPGANGVPPAGLRCQSAPACPQDAPGTCRL